MLSEKILVIDDELKVIKSIKMALVEYEIIEFRNGNDAIKYLKNPNEINLVLLDVMMPSINGMDVLKAIKENKKDMIVILMTAFASKDVAIQAIRNRADDFIEKPFDISELKEKIHVHLKEITKTKYQLKGSNEQIDRIKRFIERNYKNANLDFISNELCLSSKYLSRMFSQKNKQGFREYKLQIKIGRAKELLKETHLNVYEISIELGYQNAESFMRIFKRQTKLTPSQFRKKSRNVASLN